MQINMHEAKSQLSKLGEKAWEGETVVIAKAGKPYLDLLPHKKSTAPRQPGGYESQIQVPDDFNEVSQDIISSFEGDE